MICKAMEEGEEEAVGESDGGRKNGEDGSRSKVRGRKGDLGIRDRRERRKEVERVTRKGKKKSGKKGKRKTLTGR